MMSSVEPKNHCSLLPLSSIHPLLWGHTSHPPSMYPSLHLPLSFCGSLLRCTHSPAIPPYTTPTIHYSSSIHLHLPVHLSLSMSLSLCLSLSPWGEGLVGGYWLDYRLVVEAKCKSRKTMTDQGSGFQIRLDFLYLRLIVCQGCWLWLHRYLTHTHICHYQRGVQFVIVRVV